MRLMVMKPRRSTVDLLEKTAKQHLLVLTIILAACSQACSTTRLDPSTTTKLKTFKSDGCTCVPDGPRSTNGIYPAKNMTSLTGRAGAVEIA